MDEPWLPAAGAGGIWIANVAGNNMTFLSTTGATVNGVTNFGSNTSVNGPHFIAVDGAGNVWAANKNTGSVAEFSSFGAILSPGTGFAHSGISSGEGITLDPSGNVWVADNTTSGANGYSLFEIVGAGAPTATPIALSLKNNKVGQRP
jgi:streptogramin lyase